MSESERLEPEEIAALHSRHGEELRRFLLALLRDEALAADVSQTTFSRLIERGHETSAEGRRGWLFQVAFREAMALRRKARREANHFERIVLHDGQTRGDESPAAPLDREERLARLRRAIDALPDEQRRAFRMKFYEEKTFQRIADELGIPLGTAITRVRSATIRLRRELEDI